MFFAVGSVSNTPYSYSIHGLLAGSRNNKQSFFAEKCGKLT